MIPELGPDPRSRCTRNIYKFKSFWFYMCYLVLEQSLRCHLASVLFESIWFKTESNRCSSILKCLAKFIGISNSTSFKAFYLSFLTKRRKSNQPCQGVFEVEAFQLNFKRQAQLISESLPMPRPPSSFEECKCKYSSNGPSLL